MQDPQSITGTKSKPFVIITLGPTGAGKTGLVEQTIIHCKLNSNPPPKVFLVDDLVVNNQKYKDEVVKIIEKNKMTVATLENDITKPQVVKEFNDVYGSVRTSKGCVSSESDNCDNVLDYQMKTAIEANESFVLEITGFSIPKWVFDINWLGANTDLYDVFVSCVLVSSLDTLITRNMSRFRQAFTLFMDSQINNPAPRLPNITKKTFNENILTIKETINTMYNQCVLTKNESICGKKHIDRMLLFSNNQRMRLEFDSTIHKSEDFNEVITRVYLSNQAGGARRRRTQKRRRFHKRMNTKKVRKSIKNKRIRKHPKI